LRLNDLGFVGRGKSKHRPRNDPSLYGGLYPFVQTGDVKNADLRLTHYSQTYNEVGLSQSKLWPKGTLCITVAANIAETALLGIDACFPDSIVGFIADPHKADTRYIKYYIDTLKLKMQNVAKGTTQDNLSVEKLLSFDFRVPDVTVQQQVSNIISAYDDLIENNTRRIKLLEQMAQMLYREWFVNFRFPGHDRLRMIDSELGPIPESWTVGSLADAVILQRGFDLPKDLRLEGRIPVYAATGVNGTHAVAKVRAPGVVTGRSGSLGSVNIVLNDFWPLNTTLWVKEFRRSSPAHAYFLLKELNLGGFNSGAAVPTLNRNDIHGLNTVLPPASVLKRFDEYALPLFYLKESLEHKNSNLRTTRDLLLPKLISGEVAVEQLASEAIAQNA